MSAFESTAISQSRPADFIPGYRLEKLVGVGGMGEVHQATQLSLGRTVAVKLLNSELARDNSFVARFQKEAAALAALSHPHIVSIVDKGHAQGSYYLVMEFVDGPSLRERMRSRLDVPTALRLMVEICRAVDYAHGRGVIHRDLKPENILFDQQAGGLAKVTDFGLASFLDEGSGARFALTSTSVAMGTLSYMAPEQRVDAKSADERADVFSLGVILYELLTGEVPLGTFDLPSRRKPGVDARLDPIVTRCLKPDPADRYPRVSALLADLEPMAPTLYSQPPAPPTRVQRLGRRLRRAARLTLQAAATLVVLGALGVLGVGYKVITRGQHAPVSPGAAMAAHALPGHPTQEMPGQESDPRPELHKVTMGEGPLKLSTFVSGRPVSTHSAPLTFPAVEDSLRGVRALVQLFFPSWMKGPEHVGRAEVDLRSLEGDGVSFSGDLRVERLKERTFAEDLRAMLQPSPEAVAAMMLVGSRNRYVALVHHADGSPLSLEWALGEHSGTMTGAPDATWSDEAHLELSVSSEGVLEAFVGTGRERRRIAEPLHLGARWQEQFGAFPRPAFGCIESTCQATGFTYTVKRTPPPPPPPPPAPAPAVVVAQPAPKPAPAPAKVQAVPAKATVKPTPAPPKRPAVKPLPSKPAKRTK